MTTLGSNVKRLRAVKGWTQSELAKESGASSIAMIEAGLRKRPQYETVKKIADALGVTVADLCATPNAQDGSPRKQKRVAVRSRPSAHVLKDTRRRARSQGDRTKSTRASG